MRSEEEIKKEMAIKKERRQSYEDDVNNYNGDSGADRYMFLSSTRGITQGLDQEIKQLENELQTRQSMANSGPR